MWFWCAPTYEWRFTVSDGHWSDIYRVRPLLTLIGNIVAAATLEAQARDRVEEISTWLNIAFYAGSGTDGVACHEWNKWWDCFGPYVERDLR